MKSSDDINSYRTMMMMVMMKLLLNRYAHKPISF